MKLVTKTAIAVLPLALAATMTLADSGSTTGTWQQRRIERLQSKLGLSDDQTTAIQTAFAADQDTRRQLQSQLGQALSDFRQSALNGDDPATIEGKSTSAQQVFGQLLDLRAKQLAKIGAVLHPDQRLAFAQMNGHGGHGWWKMNRGSGATTTTPSQN